MVGASSTTRHAHVWGCRLCLAWEVPWLGLPGRKDDMGRSGGKKRGERDIFILSYPVVALLPGSTTIYTMYLTRCNLLLSLLTSHYGRPY